MSINRLLQDSAFEPEQIDRIAEAYKRVLHALRLINRIDPLTEIVAENIFKVAQTGEFDISRITELTLKDFQNTPVTAAEPEHGLNQRAEELRRIATANSSDGEALAAQPNGNWNVVKAVKIESGKAGVMLKPARQLHPGTGARGLSEAIDCLR